MLYRYDIRLNEWVPLSYTYKNTDLVRAFKGKWVKKC